MNLPLPPPGPEPDSLGEPINRVRMSVVVPDHTARAVPVLPRAPTWDRDDTTDEEDLLFDSVTSSVKVGGKVDAAIPASIAVPPSTSGTLIGVRAIAADGRAVPRTLAADVALPARIDSHRPADPRTGPRFAQRDGGDRADRRAGAEASGHPLAGLDDSRDRRSPPLDGRVQPLGGEVELVEAARRAARHTVSGVKSSRRLPLPLHADQSAPIPKLSTLGLDGPPLRLPAMPLQPSPRLPEVPRDAELSRAPDHTDRPRTGRADADGLRDAYSARGRGPRSADRADGPRSADRADVPRSADRADGPRSADPAGPDAPRATDGTRLPLRAAPLTPPGGNALPRLTSPGRAAAVAAPAPADARPRPDARPRAEDPILPATVRTDGQPRLAPFRAERAAGSGAPRPPTGPGRLVAGRYQIVERIGVGGMGKVYKVSHAQLAKTFALKVIGENLADTEEARELFYREARLASAVNHPNITSVVDFGEDPDVGAFMVMELVEGEPVHKILRRETRLGVRLACEIILQVADALHYIHSQGIVHCDIKTENILVAEQAGTKRRQILVKLLDFGLARSLTGGRGSGPLSGTPHYVSPERIRGDAATPSSDLYALGILFYELLTGHVPWDGAVSTILAGHLDQQPTPPSQIVPGLDPALETLILRAIAKSPADRHKDMAAFIYELRTSMDMMGFGQRRRGGGKRVIIERSKNERDALAARLVDGCRLPLSLISREGVILVANPACARFVMGVVVEIEGLPLVSTPLAGAWRSLEADLARAAASQPIRRILEIDVPNGPPQRLLVWLDPVGDGILFGVQPLDS